MNKIYISILAIFAFASNYLSVPVFFGADFIFGSIFVVIAIAIFGTAAGVFTAVVGGLYTYILWGHPYAIIIFTVEALFLGILFNRYRKPLILIDIGYWLIIGAPLVLILYTNILNLDYQTATFIAFKQGLNGVFNTLIAGLFTIFFFLKKRNLQVERSVSKPKITDVHFHVLLTLIIISGGIPVVLDSYQLRDDEEKHLKYTLEELGGYISNSIKENNKSKNKIESFSGVISKNTSFAIYDENNILVAKNGQISSAEKDEGEIIILKSGISIWLPESKLPALKKWRQGKYFINKSIKLDSGKNYQLVIESPANNLVDILQANRLRPFVFLSVFIILGVVISLILSRWLTSSTVKITSLSEGLTAKLIDKEKINIPEFQVFEYDQLSHSIRQMSESINEYINTIEKQSQALASAKLDAEKSQKHAELANEEKSRFLANMSHELRTPMHAILAFTQLAQKRDVDEKTVKYLNNIESSGKRLTGLINALLDLSKIESGKMDINLENENIFNITKDCTEQVNSLANAKNIEILINGNDQAFAFVDKELITQVIINLLSNAIKFSPANGIININIIDIEAIPEEDFFGVLEFVISDQGIGIPSNELEMVFDKFVQSSQSVSKAGGTGLGLPLCREIINQHNGIIWAESPIQGGDKGTAFHFIIPKTNNREVI